MITHISKYGKIVSLVMICAGLILGACGGADETADVNAVYTAAVETFVAQQETQKALIPATITPLPTLAISTITPLPTLPLPVLASPTLTKSAATGCDNSLYISDVTILDGTLVAPGQAFIKTWLVQNTGTCTWGTDYKLSFSHGEAMGGSSVPMPKVVAPNQQVEISVNLTAPNLNGTLTGNWKLMNNKGEYFGTLLTVVIKVTSTTTGTPGTQTVTPTTALGVTSTPTPTSTTQPTHTATVTPTVTSTATP
jgi:hypothetical protein